MPTKNSIFKLILKLVFKRTTSIKVSRARGERMARWMGKLPDGISIEKIDMDGLPTTWIVPETDSENVILYLHGGGYVSGSFNTHRILCSELARIAGARILFPEYRLAPEHPFPAALEDAQKAYQWLLDGGISAEDIIIAGDSAGGGLSLAILLSLQEGGLPLPAGVVCISPWTDLTLGGTSHRVKAEAEMILHPDNLRLWAQSYAGENDLKNPLISPLFGIYWALPPILIQVGSDEVLLDDAVELAENADMVMLSIYEDMWHVWHTAGRLLPESREAFDEIGEFVKGAKGDRDWRGWYE